MKKDGAFHSFNLKLIYLKHNSINRNKIVIFVLMFNSLNNKIKIFRNNNNTYY